MNFFRASSILAESSSLFEGASRSDRHSRRTQASLLSPFDVVHCNDWPAALVPAYLGELRKTTPELAATRTVLTIHNLSHQGIFPKEALPSAGLSLDHFTMDGIEFYGALNVLKYGIIAADAVTTVSANYAAEIQTLEMGDRLDGVLRARRSPVIGITNGVDYSV